MSTLHLLLPGAIDTATGGSLYDRHIVEGLRARGWAVHVRSLHTSFPAPTPAALDDAARALTDIDAGARVLIDGLALGAMPEIAAAHRQRLRLIALVHHPLALETGLPASQAATLRRSETDALRQVRRTIVTSPATARLLDGFGVAAADIDVIEPGTDPAALATGSGQGPLQLLCVGTVTPRKGHLLLIEALCGLKHLDWELACAGSLERSPDTVAAVRRRAAELGLEQRLRLLGELPPAAMPALYAGADVFVLPSLFEGYGMAYAEAMARGLPVLGTQAGAIPETVPADAGLLVEPGSVSALSKALQRLIADPDLRCRLAAGARRARARLPTWSDSASRFAEALRRV
jgi:glycosyltransferase involved in cell wall biosynthesis